jgi:hypothetical protein
MKGRMNRLAYALAMFPLMLIWMFLNYMMSKKMEEEEEIWNELVVL